MGDSAEHLGTGFVGVVATALKMLELSPASIRAKHTGDLDQLGGVFAWGATVARELALTDARFKSRDNATFSLKVNRSTLGDTLASICVIFLPDERVVFADPAVGELNASICVRPSGPRGEQVMRIRMEIEDRRDPDRNPSMCVLVVLDETEYWRDVPDDDAAAVRAAVRGCGPSLVRQLSATAGAHGVSLWGGAPPRLLEELLRSAQGECIVCRALTASRCTKCGRATYCSKKCQTDDWNKPGDGHRALCKTGVPEAAARAFGVIRAVATAIMDKPWAVAYMA